ncbi:hypothetical protein Q5762_38445, partial [Streptomyces sp. P9(2023)]
RAFEVMETPGHTLDHISYFTPGIPALLFCGDTLFHAGCGRLFEGTPEQMLTSLHRFQDPQHVKSTDLPEYINALQRPAFPGGVPQNDAMK